MGSHERACLDAVTWFESLARLSDWMVDDPPLECSLRQARTLARLAPPPYDTFVSDVPDEASFEALIERAAFEPAAVAVIGSSLSWEILARTDAGGATARVWSDDDSGEAVATAEVSAIALLRAWASFVLALAPHDGVQPAGSSHRSA